MYRILQLKKGREKSLRNRHPWVFSGALAQVYQYQNGEIVEVTDHEGQLLGYGFFSPDSMIACRIFEFTDTQTALFDDAYFEAKIRTAFSMRQLLLDLTKTDCYRLVHAEGDGFPGLIVDVYHAVAVVQLLVKGAELLLPQIRKALRALGMHSVCVKNPDVHAAEHVALPFTFLDGEPEREILIKENGLPFYVDLEKGQKTGFFLDQRDNRALVGAYAAGRTVLNAFCYTGGFSVYAAAGGAKEVTSVDISKDAVAMTERNLALSSRPECVMQCHKKDCFEYLREMPEGYYDLIILDPPAFVKSAKAIEKGARGYKDINLQALKKIRSGGLLFTFSCSQQVTQELFQKIIFSAAADAERSVRIVRSLSQGMDHPVNIFHPEGSYLKGLLLYVE